MGLLNKGKIAPADDDAAGMGHLLAAAPLLSDAVAGLASLDAADAVSGNEVKPSIPGRDQFDLVLVYNKTLPAPAPPPEVIQRRETIAARARLLGLEVDARTSHDGDEVLLKLSAPDSLLEKVAEQLTMEKKLIEGGYTDFTIADKERFVRASAGCFFTSCERVVYCHGSNSDP